MNARPFLDTNIVVYAFSSNDARRQTAEALLEAGGIISVQVLNEFVNVSRCKQGRDWSEIAGALGVLKVLLDPPQPLTLELHEAAIDIARQHGFSIYDSLIVAAALHADCTVLYSEDIQSSRAIKQLTIRNPFAE
ncbi:MAG TPA: PIN domain-containing protein [Xanthobacteraceae bacterium]|jgi:predicted nucleic acid-binding protein